MSEMRFVRKMESIEWRERVTAQAKPQRKTLKRCGK